MLSEPIKQYAQEFSKLSSSQVSDALDRLGIPGRCSSLRSFSPAGAKLCGRAFTVQFLPVGPPDKRTPNGGIGDYISDVPPGYVVALDNRGNLECSVWNELLTRSALQQGIAGTVIDGVCSEHLGSGAQPYPLFALGRHCRNGKDRMRIEAFNLPVAIGGVRVECDDIILGDDDGLVIVPRDHLASVLSAVRESAASRG